MKKKYLLILAIGTLIIIGNSGCSSTESFTSRNINVNNRDIQQEYLSLEVKVDFNTQVSATSKILHDSKRSALEESYYNCLKSNNIDVVVDPIYKITKYPIFAPREGEKSSVIKVQYKAEIYGYGGKYIKTSTVNEEIGDLKEVNLDDVIKYKLITDPNFSNSYNKAPQIIFPEFNGVTPSVEPEKNKKSSKHHLSRYLNLAK